MSEYIPPSTVDRLSFAVYFECEINDPSVVISDATPVFRKCMSFTILSTSFKDTSMTTIPIILPSFLIGPPIDTIKEPSLLFT